MGCLVTKGKTRNCRMTVGGLSELYLGNHESLGTVTYAADGSITGLTLKGDDVIYKYDFEKNTASANQPLQVGANKYVQPNVVMTIAGYDQDTKNILDVLALAKVFAIAKFRSGGYFLMGLENGLEASALEANSGAAEGDLSGNTITLQGTETEFAPAISSATVVLLAAIPTVASFLPTSGAVATAVTITGTNFKEISSVTIGGVEVALFTVVSTTSITTTVPVGAVDGAITVTGPNGTATSATNFDVTP